MQFKTNVSGPSVRTLSSKGMLAQAARTLGSQQIVPNHLDKCKQTYKSIHSKLKWLQAADYRLI